MIIMIDERDIEILMSRRYTDKIKKIIEKYRNIEIISETIDKNNKGHVDFVYELYDFLDKPGNFTNDINDIIEEVIYSLFMFKFDIKKDFIQDEYWNGVEMVPSNLYCRLEFRREW